MVKVQVWGSLKSAIGGKDAVEVDAGSIKDILQKLADQYPAMKQAIDRGVSVSVDGNMYANTVTVPVEADSEVFILPKLVGG